MKNTPNYNLPQYEGADKFTKEVLNDAFSKVDSAINDLQETFNSQTEANIDAKIIGEVATLKQNIDNIKANGIIPSSPNATLGSSTNPFKALFLSDFVKGQNGYITLPNGIVAQWGTTTINQKNNIVTSTTVTLPKQYENKIVFASSNVSSNSNGSAGYVDNMASNCHLSTAKDSFTLISKNFATLGEDMNFVVVWFTLGY